VIPPAVDLHQAMQIAPGREVVVAKWRLKKDSFTWTNIKRNNIMLY